MKILAIDVGERRVGIAISDELSITCHPFGFFDRSEAISKIQAISKEEGIDKVVVGLPLLSSGDDGSQVKDIREFCRELTSSVDLPQEFENEHLTSKMAEERLKKQFGSVPEKGSIDAMAACIILESYLAEHSVEQ